MSDKVSFKLATPTDITLTPATQAALERFGDALGNIVDTMISPEGQGIIIIDAVLMSTATFFAVASPDRNTRRLIVDRFARELREAAARRSVVVRK